MADRYVVSLVDPTNRVRMQTPKPFLGKASVPEAVAEALRNLESAPGQGAGWVITITKQESALNLHLTGDDLEQHLCRRGARN